MNNTICVKLVRNPNLDVPALMEALGSLFGSISVPRESWAKLWFLMGGYVLPYLMDKILPEFPVHVREQALKGREVRGVAYEWWCSTFEDAARGIVEGAVPEPGETNPQRATVVTYTESGLPPGVRFMTPGGVEICLMGTAALLINFNRESNYACAQALSILDSCGAPKPGLSGYIPEPLYEIEGPSELEQLFDDQLATQGLVFDDRSELEKGEAVRQWRLELGKVANQARKGKLRKVRIVPKKLEG